MSKRDPKKKVAMGATLSSKTGPKSNLRSLLKKNKEERKRKNSYERQPILIRGKDLENLDAVLKFLLRSGIPVNGYKQGYLIRRTRARIGRLKLDTYAEYLNYLRKNESEVKELHEALSINVTRFFRNGDTYDIIRTEILPEVFENNPKTNRIKMWSAGCAVGAEPYSLAMLCSDPKYQKYAIQILASDVNRDLVELAENAVYSPQYLAELTEKEASKYFYRNNDGNYKIRSSVKKYVKFDVLDLTKDSFPRNLDLILCRNVLIYIDKQMQELIIEKFCESLNIGGILILGRTETLWGMWKHRFEPISAKHRIYRKIA
ncbi:MAG: CheR family methyltransferase [Candidatus Kariarchaeaceae archaeon]|jgi:chemotaxis methyl-accepting protein methylase